MSCLMAKHIRHSLVSVIRGLKCGNRVLLLFGDVTGAMADRLPAAGLFKHDLYIFCILFSSCSKLVFMVSMCVDVFFECFTCMS